MLSPICTSNRFVGIALGLCILSLSACKKADPIVGEWRVPTGQSIIFHPDLTFELGTGESAATGTWSFVDNKVTYIISKIGGKPAAQGLRDSAKMQLSRSYQDPPQEAIDAMADQMRTAVYVLAKDGKTLSKNGLEPGPANTYTKVESE